MTDTRDQRAAKLAQLGRLRAEAASLERELELPPPNVPPHLGREAGLGVYELFSEHGSDMLSIHAPNGDYLWVSTLVEHLFGWRPPDLVGRNAYELFHPDDIARVAQDHAGHPDAEQGTVRYRLRCHDGGYRWVETRSRARHDGEHVREIMAVTRDIHERHRNELAALTYRLATSLAHEINNPLSIAVGCLDQLDDPSAREDLEAALTRIGDTVREMDAVATAGQGRVKERVALRRAFEQSVHRFGRGRRPVRLACGEAETEADPLRLHQLLHTLLLIYLQEGRNAPPVSAACDRTRDAIVVTMTGEVREVPSTMRADLAGALTGDGPRAMLPLQLASLIAEQLGGGVDARHEAGALHVALRLPPAP